MSDLAVCTVGTGAVRVNLNRGGPAYVIESGQEKLLVDCGRSTVHNLVRAGYRVESIDTVLITHLHFDHVSDLATFVMLGWNNGRRKRITFYGPPGLGEFLTHNITQAYNQDIHSRLGHGKDPLGIEWDVIEVDDNGQVAEIGDLTIDALYTEHGGMPNINYRFKRRDKVAVITSDTSPDAGLTDFCREADLLVCECSGTKAFLDERPWGTWHLWPEVIADMVREAHVDHVVLSHLVIENWTDDPLISQKMADTVRETCGDTRVTVGEDGLKITL